MKPFTTPLRLLTLPAWLAPRRAHDRREPNLETELWHDTEPNGPAARDGRPGSAPSQPPLSRDEIERALEAGTQRPFAPRADAEVMRGH